MAGSWATHMSRLLIVHCYISWTERKTGRKKDISNWTSNNKSHFVWSGERTQKQGLIWNHNKLDLSGMGWKKKEEWMEERRRRAGVERGLPKRWDYIAKAIITLPHLARSQERTCGISRHLRIYTQTHIQHFLLSPHTWTWMCICCMRYTVRCCMSLYRSMFI